MDEELLARGKNFLGVTITFVAAGIRKAGDKHDVCGLAEKLVDWARRFDQKSDDQTD